jgi:ATP-binding cassette subfamily C protein LapB
MADLKAVARPPLIAPWLLQPVLANRWTYGQVAAAAVLINLFSLATSLFTMTVYDRVVPNNALESLAALSIGMGIVLVFDFVLKSLRGYFIDVAGQRIDREVGGSIFNQLLTMRMESRRGSAGSFAGLLREFEALRDFFASATIAAVVDVPFILLFLLVIALIGGWLVLVPALMVPLVVIVGLATQPALARLTAASMSQGLSKQGVLVETISGLETVKSSRAGPILTQRWDRAVEAHADQSLRQRMVASITVNTAGFAQSFAYIGIVVFGVNMIADGTLTTGGLIACSILGGRCVAPLSQIASLLTRISHTRTAYRELDKMMQTHGEYVEDVSYLRREKLVGSITFRNVTFRYPGTGAKALDDVSFHIAPGERVAVLGRIGSGKSTLARLVLGLYQPDEGSVLIDDSDVRQIHPDDLRRGVGSVMQDVFLLSGSVRENITLGDPTITDEEVLRAAKISGVHDFIGQVPNGYDLRLADRGEGLSGGQRQSIAIARALTGKHQILLFDEPTSAMDIQSENALVARLEQELQGRTLLIITHRASLLRLVEKIIVMDRGKITAYGPRDEILRQLAPQPRPS